MLEIIGTSREEPEQGRSGETLSMWGQEYCELSLENVSSWSLIVP